jgi:hypothetical protein
MTTEDERRHRIQRIVVRLQAEGRDAEAAELLELWSDLEVLEAELEEEDRGIDPRPGHRIELDHDRIAEALDKVEKAGRSPNAKRTAFGKVLVR